MASEDGERGDSGEHDLGPLTGYPQGEPVAVDVGRRRLVVVRDGERVFALRDVCPHQGAALSAGRVISTCRMHREDGGWVQTDLRALQCPWHGWAFELDDGRAVFEASGARVRSYPARVAGGRVHVRVER
jgi:nitrite reductase/ring-hydroxylating ferredoxin subunit